MLQAQRQAELFCHRKYYNKGFTIGVDCCSERVNSMQHSRELVVTLLASMLVLARAQYQSQAKGQQDVFSHDR